MGVTKKDPAEVIQLPFDYSADIGAATISSAAVTNAVVSGTDAGAAAMLSGAAVISGSKVNQLLQNGIDGVLYEVRCLATLSDGRKLLRTITVKAVAE